MQDEGISNQQLTMMIPISRARSKLGGLIKKSRSSGREIVVTKRGIPAAVLMDYDIYKSRKETAAVTADRPLMKDIRRGLRELKTGKSRLYTLEELFSNK